MRSGEKWTEGLVHFVWKGNSRWTNNRLPGREGMQSLSLGLSYPPSLETWFYATTHRHLFPLCILSREIYERKRMERNKPFSLHFDHNVRGQSNFASCLTHSLSPNTFSALSFHSLNAMENCECRVLLLLHSSSRRFGVCYRLNDHSKNHPLFSPHMDHFSFSSISLSFRLTKK